jgi:fibulin 1/2
MAQEQCCHSQLEELHCATGINLANEQENCALPHSGNTSHFEAMFVKVSRDLGSMWGHCCS